MTDSLWMVQYNLSGLQKPRKLTKLSGFIQGWWDKSEEFGEHGEERPTSYHKYDVCRLFFNTKEEAYMMYKELDEYRKFIKRHL